MYSGQESNESKSSPSAYGREQFEQEAGIRHTNEEYATELTPAPTVKWRDAMARYHAPAGQEALTRQEKQPPHSDAADDPLAAVGALVEDEESTVTQNKSLGIVALVLAAVSLFFLSAVLGPASIVVGFAAYMRGNRTLGIWSMALGLLAVAAYFVLVPYYTVSR